MKIPLKKIKEGDFVYCTGDSGFCTPSTEQVKKITVCYDGKTGKPYNVIWLDGGRKFDARHGGALNSPTAYYLEPTDQERATSEKEKKDKEEQEKENAYRERQRKRRVILAKLTQEEREILGL